MVLLKNRQVAENTWTFIADDEVLPNTGNLIVTLQRWNDEKERLQTHSGAIGVELDGGDDAYEIDADILALPLIALAFPKFGDGRNYSNARILREYRGYKGDIRARGEILRDQLFYLWRVGINEHELADGVSVESALTAFQDFSVLYQPSSDQPNPIFRQ